MGTPLLCRNLHSLRSLARGFSGSFETAQPKVIAGHRRYEARRPEQSAEAAYE